MMTDIELKRLRDKTIQELSKSKKKKWDINDVKDFVSNIFCRIENHQEDRMPIMTCPECKGTGIIKRVRIQTIPYVGDEVTEYEGVCNWCKGKGYLEGEVLHDGNKIL